MGTDSSAVQRSRVVTGLSRIRNYLAGVAAGSRAAALVRGLWPRDRPSRTADEAGASDEPDDPAERFVPESVWRRSLVWRTTRGTLAVLGLAAQRSRLSGLTGRFQGFVEASWLYRWLTAEPDPDVVVIDLRETLTVGPWLAAIDRTLRWLLPATVSSGLFRLGGRTAAVLRARPVQLLSLLVGSGAAAGLLLTVATGEPSPPAVAVLALVVVFAALGSREDRSWTEVRESRWVGLLAAAFEPPEPPARPEDRDETASEQREDDTGSPADEEDGDPATGETTDAASSANGDEDENAA